MPPHQRRSPRAPYRPQETRQLNMPQPLDLSYEELCRPSCDLDDRAEPGAACFCGHVDKRAEPRAEQLSVREDERLPLCVPVGQVRKRERHLERNVRIARRLDGRVHAPPPHPSRFRAS